jgi:hypothetical protein
VSAKIVPTVGEFFGFNGENVSVLEGDTLQPKQLKARLVSEDEFVSLENGAT